MTTSDMGHNTPQQHAKMLPPLDPARNRYYNQLITKLMNSDPANFLDD